MSSGATWIDFALRVLLSAPLLYCVLFMAVAPARVVQWFEDAHLRLGGSPWFGQMHRRTEAPPSGFVRWIGILFSVFWLVRVTGLDSLATR